MTNNDLLDKQFPVPKPHRLSGNLHIPMAELANKNIGFGSTKLMDSLV
jgi:hypothetical protein